MRRGLIASFTAAGILVTSLLLTPAWAVPNYPSAAEVAAAKRSVTEKKKMITRIEGILNTLESEARELEAIALEKSEQYIRALKRADDMREKVKSLQDQAKASANKAETARLQLCRAQERLAQSLLRSVCAQLLDLHDVDVPDPPHCLAS